MSSTAADNLYDTLPYPPLSYVQTHPDRMATVATLLGLAAPPLEGSRVLEVGSAVGGNLIPMALQMPGASFLGIDYSEVQVEAARRAVHELGLTNIAFEHTDIRDFKPTGKPFDFVIAHGFYSWVPADAREALFDLCAGHLSPRGIAYISYNTFPGWYGLGMVRGIMQTAAAGIEDPIEQARAAVDAVRFFRDVRPDDHPTGAYLDWYMEVERSRLELGDERAAKLLMHDELSEINDPCYLRDFVAHAEGRGLAYLADAELKTSFPNNVPAEVQAELGKRARSAVEFEQYLDFLGYSTFRRALLVRDASGLRRQLSADPERMRRYHIRSRALPSGEVDPADASVATFAIPRGPQIATNHPLSKAAMLHLRDSAPAVVSFDELVEGAAARLPGQEVTVVDLRELGANLLRGYTNNSDLIDLRLERPRFATTAGARPSADPYARALAAAGEVQVTNRFHERVQLHPAQAIVLPLLDGSRDRQSLVEHLEANYAAVGNDGSETEPPSWQAVVEESLQFFAAAALLAG